jgi:hypothetical protein
MGDQTNTASSDRLDHQAIPGAREPSLRVTGPDRTNDPLPTRRPRPVPKPPRPQ